MDVTAKQKLLFNKLKLKIKKLQQKQAQSRAKIRAALDQVNKVSHSYKIKLARKMREMERKLAHTEAASYVKAAADLEEQLVKGIKRKVKALTAAAKRAKRSKTKSATPRKKG